MFKTERDHIIWDEDITQEEIDEYIDDMRDEYPDEDESTLEKWARQAHADQLDDEKANLKDIRPKNGILGLSVLGLWDGRPSAILVDDVVSVPDCMKSYVSGGAYSSLYIYVDGEGEFRIQEAHHDGTNNYWFRTWRHGVPEYKKEELRDLIYNQGDYKGLLDMLTYRLGDLIGDVYGWEFSNRPTASVLKNLA